MYVCTLLHEYTGKFSVGSRDGLDTRTIDTTDTVTVAVTVTVTVTVTVKVKVTVRSLRRSEHCHVAKAPCVLCNVKSVLQVASHASFSLHMNVEILEATLVTIQNMNPFRIFRLLFLRKQQQLSNLVTLLEVSIPTRGRMPTRVEASCVVGL